ncbi:hypothetical protein DWU98_21440, partial [Dyella monticola]
LVARNFETCTFDFKDTKYFSHVEKKDALKPITSGDGCILDIHAMGNIYNADSDIWISVSSTHDLDQVIAYQGFFKNEAGEWVFNGKPMRTSFISFKHLSLGRIYREDGLILVGRQVEKSKDQKGTLLTFEGVHILRITQSYLVSMDMPFIFYTPKETRDDVIKDMVNLVGSVHVTTNP